MFLFSGCIPYQGERPTDFGLSEWVSSDPYMWFKVSEITNDPTASEIIPKGQIVLQSKTIEFNVHFDGGSSAWFYTPNEEGTLLFIGACKFSPEKLIVKIDKSTDTIFNGKKDEITFVRKR